MIILSTTVSVIAMILLPVFLAAFLRRRVFTPWILFSIGSLTFALSQVIHFPLNNLLAEIGILPGEGTAVPHWQEALVLGLTAGLSEELLRAVGYAALLRWKPGWLRLKDAVMLGLGHGGIEAMLFGGVLTAAAVSALLPLQGVDLNSLGLAPEQLANLKLQVEGLTGEPYAPLIPLLERGLAITAHVVFSLVVWRAFAGAGRRWLSIGMAVLYHTVVDAGIVYALRALPEIGYWVEALFAGLLLPGILWAIWLVRQERQGEPGAVRGSLREDWRVFMIATLKELRQLWRTKRFLVVGAVFLLFGMGSPLIARLTPEILGSIEGAEMFADLIPEPTAGDAMAQYLKNLTQFGFIIAILVGMAAVAGEREQGIAPMILSKPMPRWAFLASKFAAQFVMYAVMFLLAASGAYLYTWFLFGALDPKAFLLMNGLLLLWLSSFVALSLLASTLGRSTAAAGGIGLGLASAILLAGSLPKYGALFPGGLVSWANQLGLDAAGVEASGLNAVSNTLGANGGAAAGALALIVMALVITAGFFEQQEL